MLYLEQDRREIRNWIKVADDKVREELRTEFREEIHSQQSNFITAQQLAQYDANLKADAEILIGNKIRENNLWVTEKIAAVQKTFENFIADDFDRLKNSSDATAQEVKALKSEVDKLKTAQPSTQPTVEVDAQPTAEIDALAKKVDDLSAENDVLTKKVDGLSAENDALKKQLAQHDKNFAVVTQALNDIQKNFIGLLQQRDAQILSLKAEVDELKAAQPSAQPPPEVDAQSTADFDALTAEVAALKAEVDKLKAAQPSTQPTPEVAAQPTAEVDKLTAEVAALKTKVDELERRVAELEPPIAYDDKFFLLAQTEEFLPADRKKIPAKVKEALNLRDAENFLTEHPSSISKQFQKLLAAHTKEVKRFVDKLKLNDLDDEELSENVTAKYFKLFQRTIFDNLLIAIRRGLKNADKDTKAFYSDFLRELNDYLMRCGIYSLNVTSDRRAESDDYENMTPQVIKTVDEDLSGKIASIERLPYRINYLDEFGEQKFFQYAGLMSVYKAV